MDFLGIGWGEILVILLVVLLIWGPGRLIEISRTLGKTMNALKKMAGDLNAQVVRELDNQQKSQIDHENAKGDPAQQLIPQNRHCEDREI
jgi:Tat protein translocase TatB subunit